MANPFLEDFLTELEEIESQKLETEPTESKEKSFAYDVIGSTLWSFADEAGFGLPEYAARKAGYEEEVESLLPESLTAKIGSGIGSLAGFALGLPYKTGTKLASLAVRPLLKEGVEEAGEYALGQTAAQVAKKAKKKAIDSGMKKEVAEDFTNKYISFTRAAGARKDISKDFVEKSTQAIDDLVLHHTAKGNLKADDLRIVNNIFKRDLTRKPLADFKELFSAKNIGGEKAALYGNMADEVLIFGAIDAISEGVRSQAQDRPYDWMAPVWGGAIGVGFGGLKFLAPKGKSSNFRTEMVDGIKGYMNKDIFSKMNNATLKKQSRWLGDILSDSQADVDNIIQSVRIDGTKYEFDLLNPEFLDQHGALIASRVMKKGLNQLRQKYSKELINNALKEEWGSLSENFMRMIAGGVIMSGRTLYEITQGADIPAEDIIPTMLIGGWVNRRGMSRVYDMHTRTNKIRKNLSVLGVDTRNLVNDIPTFNPYLAAYNNPTETNDNIKAFRDKAEELNIITDDYDQSELDLRGESVLSAEANRGGYDVFKAFYQLLGGQKKYTKPLDRISADDADIMMDVIKDVKWEQLDGKKIKNAQEAFQVFDNIAQQSSEIFERNMVNVLNRVAKIEGLNIDGTKLNVNNASMGSFPKRLIPSDEGVEPILALAREGKIIEGLEGEAAVAKVNEYIKKVNLIIDGLGNDGGIARLKLEEPTREQFVSDKESFDSIKLIIDEFESAVNTATGARNDFKFDTINHLEDLVWLMHTNNAKKASEKISNLVSQGAPGHDQLKQLLLKTGIFRLNDDMTMSMVNNASKNNIVIETSAGKTPEKETQYRRLLSSVLGIMGAKGEYSRTEVTEPTVIKVADVQNLERFLKKQGMRTDSFVMEQWNNYVIDFINRKNIEGSDLSIEDIGFVTSLMDNQLGLASFSRAAGEGYTLSKIVIDDTMSATVKGSAEAYNAYVDGVISRGASAKGKVISYGDPKEYVDPDVITALDIDVGNIQKGIDGSANKVLTDMLNSIRNNHATFTEQMRVFANTNASHGLLLNSMLIQAKVIKKEGTANKTQWKFDEDMLSSKDASGKTVIENLQEMMQDYGTSFDDVDALLQRENENMNELFSRLDDKPVNTQNSLSQDQFFKRYISDDLSIESQNMYLDSMASKKLIGQNPMEMLAKQANVKFNINGENLLYRDLDFNNKKHLQSYKNYLDHAGALMSSRSNSVKKVVLSFENGNTTGKYRTMQNTPFMKLMDDIFYTEGSIEGNGVNYYFLSGSAENIVMDHRGISRKHFSIFDGDSNHLSKKDKIFLKSEYKKFEDDLSGLNALDVRKKMSMLDTENLTFDGGLAVFRISGSLNPIAIPKNEMFKIRDAYASMLERHKDSMGSQLYNEGLGRLKKLDTDPTVKSAAHEVALRQLMFEKLLSSKNDATNFIKALKDEVDDLGKLGSRFNLLHTPNFKRLDKKIAESMAVTSSEKQLVSKFHNRGTARVAIWNDKDNASVKETLLRDSKFRNEKEVDDFFQRELYSRGDETAYDSITYISKEYMDYLKIAYSRNARKGTELFKPVISSNEDALLFGKTVFVYEPKMDGFFNNNGVDILTTASASKVKGDNWKMIEASDVELPNIKIDSTPDIDGKIGLREIPLESVGIKQDRVKDRDMGKFSIQAYNYLSSAEANSIYGELYSDKLNLAMEEMQRLYENPLRRRAFFQQGFGDDQSIQSLMETGAGSQNLAAALRYSRVGDPIDLGQKMIMSQFYRKLVDPVINQNAMIDGKRAGGKAVLIQSLDASNKVKPTIFRNGKLEQYGEIMIPAYEADEIVSLKKNEKNKVRILDRETNKVLELEDVFGKQFVDEQIDQLTLGDLHFMIGADYGLFPQGKYQLAMVTNRYPRTRPNDMTIMGLKGFLDEKYGNSMIVNELDVLNIFEGDYDVDKNDYYFMHSKNMFDHIQQTQQNFIQGIDPGRFSADIPNIGLSGNDEAINEAWHTHASNTNTLRAGIGIVQKLQRSVNWFKDKLGPKDEETGLYDVIKSDDFTIKMDYDNQDWWHRTVLETQGIIDAGSGVDGQLIDVMGNWRSEYLFPPVSKAREKIEGANPGSNRDQKRSQYLEDLRSGGIPERIPLFRKYDADGKEISLDTVDKEMILYHLNKYGKFLSLSTNIYDGSGMGKKPSYHDVIDYSDDFFSYASNHNNMYYALKAKFKGKGYTATDRQRLNSYFGAEERDFVDFRTGKTTKTYLAATKTPFTEDFRINLEESAKGNHGNVYDRLMWNIHNADPLSARSYAGLTGNEVKQVDDMFQRVRAEGDYEKFTSDVLAFAGTKNKQIKTLAFLKRKFGFLNRLRVSAKRKQELIDANNQAILELENKLEGMLPYEYKKSKSAKALKNAYVKILDIENNQQLKDDSTVLYTLEELTKHNYGAAGMRTEIDQLKSFERRIFGDLNNLGETLQFDKKTAMSEGMKDYVGKLPNHLTVNEMIEIKLREGVDKHGFAFLYHYAMPAKQNAVGIFNGVAHAVSHKRNARFERILKFMGKNADEPEFENALKVMGNVTSYYRNYFNKNHRLMNPDNMSISNNIYAFQDGLTFPKFNKGMQDSFNSFRNFKWKKETGGNSDPFKIQDDYNMSFYRDFFEVQGKGEEFNRYMGQRSVLQQHLLSTQHVDPIAYLAMISKMDNSIHEFASKKITGAVDHDGRFWKFDKNRVSADLRSNPIYHLLGGDKYFKGISLNFPKRHNNYSISSMQAFSKQANTIIDEAPSSRKAGKIFDVLKQCSIGGS